MTIIELRNKVFAELDSRDLADPSIRKRAFNHVLDYIRQSEYYNNEKLILPPDKNNFKKNYETYKCKKLNGAEKSIINEMYNQYKL